jgi:hypothetical protein
MSKQVSIARTRVKDDMIKKSVYDVLDGNFDFAESKNQMARRSLAHQISMPEKMNPT